MAMQANEIRRLTIASSNATLEAILQTPDTTISGAILVVCHPHPLYGGSMHNNVVDALCEAALQEGVAALRFNFRGVGASSGSHTGGEGEEADVIAALRTAMDLSGSGGPMAAGLAGYSFGAGMAARVASGADPQPRVLVLISPPMSTLAPSLLGDPDVREATGARASTLPPLLMMTGDRDHVCPPSEMENLAIRLQPPPDRVVIDGADHSWFGHESELRDTVGGFLRWHLATG